MKLRNCLCLALWLMCSLACAGPLLLTGEKSQIDLTPYLELHEDASARLDVAAISNSAQFQPATTPLLRPDYTKAALWLKLTLTNTTSLPMTRWLSIQPARLQEVSLFTQRDGRWQRSDAGSSVPFDKHPLAVLGAVFPLHLAAATSTTVYVRIAGQTSIVIAPTLWEPMAFQQASTGQIIYDCLFLGGLALTALYALLMFATLRERTFLFHSIAMLSYCLFEVSFSGYGLMFFWPRATTWATSSILFFGILTAISLLVFIRDLLMTRHRLPRWDRVLKILLAVLPLLLLALPWVSYRTLAPISLVIGSLALLAIVVTTLLTMRRHFSAVRFYLLAFSLALIGNIARNLSVYGLIHSTEWLNYVRPLYTVIGSLFMLTAVVDNISRAKKSKVKAQQQLLKTYSSYQTKLEQEVAERTADLHAALAETRSANQARSRLLAYISHDLRAPLATIISYVHRLNRDANTQALAYQSTIEHYAQHQLELIDDLVEYARGELDQLELHATPMYLHAWLASVTRQAKLLAAQYGNHFSAVLDAQMPAAVRVDPKRLRQVLLNLLSNAAKFTNAGSIVLRVDLETLAPPQVALTFTVTDTGSGIAQPALERIFEPFERLQSEQQGSGLGLSIARQIVRNMGSELEVDSVPGQGSRFSFRLLLDTAPESEIVLPLHTGMGLAHVGQGRRVLVVDDDAASRDYLLEMLAAADFDVVLAADGSAALQQLQRQTCDVVLTDQCMPHRDGWALLQQMRRHYPAIPVVLCSATPPQPPAGMVGIGAQLHFDASLLKPVMPDQLLSCMATLFTPPVMVPQAAAVALPASFISALRQHVALGDISEIESLTLQLAQDHPEHAALAADVRQAALRIDFAAITALLAQQR